VLRHGDRMTRAEFERRWDAMPDLKRAELIEGVVYIMPALSRDHGVSHFDLITLLGWYRAQTPGVEGADNASVRFDDLNMPQPDILLCIQETQGGRSTVSEDGYYEHGPELVAEVAVTSVAHDLGVKLKVYQRDGVPEYLVWRVEDRELDWFVLREGKYARLEPGVDGVFRSEVFPGLWIDPAALVAGDGAKLFAVAQQGHASPEHAAFVSELQRRASARGSNSPGLD
jgi:Uma2 family endonuclease